MKVSKTFHKGDFVTVIAGKHDGRHGIVEHSDSSITTVCFKEAPQRPEPVWTIHLRRFDLETL